MYEFDKKTTSQTVKTSKRIRFTGALGNTQYRVIVAVHYQVYKAFIQQLHTINDVVATMCDKTIEKHLGF
jgi:mRNA-degrading endonuclease HigB of HigAB toxin-antitoxin module